LAEFVAIRGYISNFFTVVNPALFNESKEREKLIPIIHTMMAGMHKLPVYRGLVLRGVDLPDLVLKSHQAGQVVTYKAFTSTAKAKPLQRKHLLRIISKSCRDISELNDIEMDEVLCFPGTKFLIQRREDNPTVEILMEEILDVLVLPR
jgi:hypothetical protein